MKRLKILAATLAVTFAAGGLLLGACAFMDKNSNRSRDRRDREDREDDDRVDRDEGRTDTHVTLENVEAASGSSGLDIERISNTSYDNATQEAYLQFVFGLYSECASSAEANGNVMISPASVLMALGMTSAGSGGDTLEQMVQTMAPGQDFYALQSFAADYNGRLNTSASDGASISCANSLWFNRANVIPVYQDFLDYVTDNYGAAVSVVPFDNEGVNMINNWVGENTNGMIPEIIDRLTDDGYAVLVNAIAFESGWMVQYEDDDIRPGTFTDSEGRTENVDMMHGSDGLYLQTDLATGFMKIYEGGEYAFMAILPADDTISANEFASSLTADEYLALWNSRESGCELYTTMPEFECDYGVEMSDILQDMGMQAPFEEFGADFSNMTEEQIYISEVIHRTHIEVNRAGTRASAATAVEATVAGCIEETEIRTVVLDRPFVYAVIELDTGLPLFIGTVNTVTGG